MGFSSFQGRDTKYEKILANNQATYYKRKLLHFLCRSELSKSEKIWLSKSIFYGKNMNANLSSSKFFAIDIFWQLQFLKSFIFWNDAQFLTTWKLDNPFYHSCCGGCKLLVFHAWYICQHLSFYKRLYSIISPSAFQVENLETMSRL